MLAVIGGSGLSQLASLEVTQRKMVRTPYGEPSGALTLGRIRGRELVFLARHGYGHTVAPHEVNYRANLWALKDAGVEGVVSVASVGGIRRDIVPGALAVPDQIIDYTWGRRSTYFEGAGAQVTHVDFTEPYSAPLRARILGAAHACGEQIIDGGIYAATQGPRLESAAEINRLERDGAHMVGMTGMPEAVLARELELPYAAIAVSANYAAGRGESAHAVPMERIEAVLAEAMGRVRRVIEQLVAG
ncbi:MAG: S-methyl-5'-thioinosine phosphorylase [Betaproteobacteria bacterium]|nr:S-methyl-5'-thioinosine phosphorylase [Betaproteobacteria bacterium]MDH5221349.1 S-methyl-5'-thioinosine phosphorylase [Betaproteobacteria bacterium]MDH5350343.1 S-methyl-5'-thioinosine phosphorylase [Betaproteobacteria bacterium]